MTCSHSCVPRPPATAAKVQQRGVDAAKAIVLGLLEGLDIQTGRPVLIVDCIANRFLALSCMFAVGPTSDYRTISQVQRVGPSSLAIAKGLPDNTWCTWTQVLLHGVVHRRQHPDG